MLVAPCAACVNIGKVRLQTCGSLMLEGQFEALWLLAEGFESADIYRDQFSARLAVAVEEAEVEVEQGEQATLVSRTRSRIVLIAGPE